MHAAAAAAVAATIDSPNVTTASAITAITTSAAAIPATTAFTQRLLHVHRRALSIAWPVFSRAGNMYRLQRFAAPFHTAERPDLRPRHIHSTGPVTVEKTCLLYTSDAADDLLCVDLGGRRIIKKKNKTQHT